MLIFLFLKLSLIELNFSPHTYISANRKLEVTRRREPMKKKTVIEALSSETRRRIIKTLLNRELHLSALSKELKFSKPVIARHVKVLEESGLVERKVFGGVHVLKVKSDKIYSALDELSEPCAISVKKGTYLLDALRQIAGVSVKNIKGKEFVAAIDGEEGYYIYEVNGELPNVPMSEYKIEKDAKVELKRLYPVKKKIMKIKVKL